MAALTFNSLVTTEIKKLITAQIAEDSNNLASGSAADYATYRERVGKIRGLLEAFELCDEAQKAIDKHQRGAD